MPQYKNISKTNVSLIHKGRKISISPGQIIEGPETFNMYKDLKKVDENEIERYNKSVSKVMRYNPTEAKRLNLNVETFTKVNSPVNDYKPLKFNEEQVINVISYINKINKNTKPSVSVNIIGNSIQYNKQVEECKKFITYENVSYYNNANNFSITSDFIISHNTDMEVNYDYVSEVVKIGMINSVSLPTPFVLESLDKNWIRQTIKEKYTKKINVLMTIATLSNNERQYKDFLNDLSKQKTNSKIEILIAPNYANIYKSCSEALNILKFLSNGEFVNLCHQDLRCQPYWIQNILSHIRQLDSKKSKWGVLGMAGSSISTNPPSEYNALYLGDGKSGRSFSNHFRQVYGIRKEVQCVDELALIVRKEDGIWFDEETFDHYHYYGADICLQHLYKGNINYAIDAECIHLSDGQSNLDNHKKEYIDNSIKLYNKWKDKFSCWKTTTANFRPDQGLIVPLIFVIMNMKRGNKDLPQVIYIK